MRFVSSATGPVSSCNSCAHTTEQKWPQINVLALRSMRKRAEFRRMQTHRRTANAERTWATPEIYYAVELGYEVIRIHQVWAGRDYPDRVISL